MERVTSTIKMWGDKLIICRNPHLKNYMIAWDMQELEPDEDGVVKYSYLVENIDSLPTKEQVKSIVWGYYNKMCDLKILSGLKYEGSTVWLSQENQFNYKAAWDFAYQTQGESLPVTFKLGEEDNPVYKRFNTVEELQEFIVLVIQHINNTLSEYWGIKDSVDWTKYEL